MDELSLSSHLDDGAFSLAALLTGASALQAGKSRAMLPARKKISKAKGVEPNSFEDSVASVRDDALCFDVLLSLCAMLEHEVWIW